MKIRDYIKENAYAPSKYTLLLGNGGCGCEFYMECLPEEEDGIHFIKYKSDSCNHSFDFFQQLDDEELDELIENLIEYRKYVNSQIS